MGLKIPCPLKACRFKSGPRYHFYFFKIDGVIAQLGERLFCTQEVSGSIPLSSTIYFLGESFKEVIFGSVAQLARANGSYPLGRGFESLRSHHNFGPVAQLVRATGS